MGQSLDFSVHQQRVHTVREFLQYFAVYFPLKATREDAYTGMLKYETPQQLVIGLGLLGLTNDVVENEVYVSMGMLKVD